MNNLNELARFVVLTGILSTVSASEGMINEQKGVPDMISALKDVIEKSFNIRDQVVFIGAIELGGDDMVCIPIPRPKPKPEPEPQ